MGSRAMKRRRGTKVSNKKSIVLGVLTVFVGLVVVGCIGVFSLCSSWLTDLPDYANADAYNSSKPTTVYAADGTTVLAEFQLENREPVTLEQISPYVLEGTVATEDERFYSHNGVDMFGIARALVNNMLGGELEGASTITQQFVRNTILSEEMNDISLKRKVREAYISLKLEEQYDKDEILLMYLNTINYGSGAYGIQAAAQRYFSLNANELNVVQAATLVGIPQSPTYNNPIDNPENCLKRRNVVLERMLRNGFIDQATYDQAVATPLELNPTTFSQTGILAYPYFTSYVRDQLTDPNGKYAYSTAEIFKGGLTVYTTLDPFIQDAAQDAADEKQAQTGEPFEVSLVAIDPDNGFIRAMVGGKDFNETQVNMATGSGGSGRQAGSSFKTFTLAAAIEEGIDPETMIDAGSRAEFPGWSVHNIGYVDYGTRSITSAFAVSSNTAFARLCLALGPSKVAEMAHKLGITSTLENVGSLTLGTSLVTPLEMADAYATLANGGTHYDPECITRIVDRTGKVIVDNEHPEGERVISEEVAHATVEVMKGVVTSGTGRAARLSSGQVAAGKTGTADLYKDNWFCGITPQLSVAIWLGDRSDITVAKSIPGGITAASVFARFLDTVLEGQPHEEFPTAGKPVYTKYTNAEYNIGGYYGSGDSDADEKAEDAESGQIQEPVDPPTGSEGGGNEGGGTSPEQPENPTQPDNPEPPAPPTGGDPDPGETENPGGGDDGGDGGGDNPPAENSD